MTFVEHTKPRYLLALLKTYVDQQRHKNMALFEAEKTRLATQRQFELAQVRLYAEQLMNGEFIRWDNFPPVEGFPTEFLSLFINHNHLLTVKRRGLPPHHNISLLVGAHSFALNTQIDVSIASSDQPAIIRPSWHFKVDELEGSPIGRYGFEGCNDTIFGTYGGDNYDIALPIHREGRITTVTAKTNVTKPQVLTLKQEGLQIQPDPHITAWFYNNLRSK